MRDDNISVIGDNSAQAVHSFMASHVSFANGSKDYACTSTDRHTRGADNALLVYDKCEKAGVKGIMESSKHMYGPKSVLTQMSKTVMLCQKSGNEIARVRWFVCFTHHRLSSGNLDADATADFLKTKFFPICQQVWELVTQIPPLIPYNFNPDATADEINSTWVTNTAAQPLWLKSAKSGNDKSIGVMFDLTPSARSAVKFMDSLYSSEKDWLMIEMASNCKQMAPFQKLSYDKLDNFKESLLSAYNDEKRVTLDPPGHADVASDADATAAVEKQALDDVALKGEWADREKRAAIPAPVKDKETCISEWYDRYTKEQMEENLVFAERPLTKTDWNAFVKSHTFITNRKCDTMWLYSPDLDKEPQPGERQSQHNWRCAADTTMVDNFFSAIEDVMIGGESTFKDVVVTCDGKHRRNLTACLKSLKKAKDDFPLTCMYKQTAVVDVIGTHSARGEVQLVESVSYNTLQPFKAPHKNRLFYTLTTCRANAVIQMDVIDSDDVVKVQKSLKETIHGGNASLPRQERALGPDKKVPLFTHEVHPKVWREHFHTLGCGRVVTPSCGGGPLLKAMLQSEVLGLLICNNAHHQRHLEDYVRYYIRMEAIGNRESRFFMPRAKVIKLLGLAPDGSVLTHGTSSDSECDDDKPVLNLTGLSMPVGESIISTPVGGSIISTPVGGSNMPVLSEQVGGSIMHPAAAGSIMPRAAGSATQSDSAVIAPVEVNVPEPEPNLETDDFDMADSELFGLGHGDVSSDAVFDDPLTSVFDKERPAIAEIPAPKKKPRAQKKKEDSEAPSVRGKRTSTKSLK